MFGYNKVRDCDIIMIIVNTIKKHYFKVCKSGSIELLSNLSTRF